MLTQIKRGIGMTVDSFVVMRNNPKLLVFPVFAGLGALGFLALLFGSTLTGIIGVEGIEAIETQAALEETASNNTAILLAAVFLGYLGTTFVSVFFTAALVAESREVFAGNRVSLKRGIAAAWDAKYQLLAWAVIAATVGVIIDAIENSDSTVGQVFAWVFGVAWSVITFLVVPVAVLDDDSSVRGMFSRSGRTFRENIGETVVGVFAPRVVGGVIAVLTIGAVIGLLELGVTGLVVLPVLVVGLIVAQLLSTTIRGIIKTSLYVYATEGRQPGTFDSGRFSSMLKNG
jgi:hypothetical protein